MAKLFEIVGEFQKLYDLATDEEVDPEVFEGTLESLMGDLSVKGRGYVAVINQLEMEIAKADEISKRYAAIKKSRENAVKKIKERLLLAMEVMEMEEVEAGDFKIKIKKNGGKQPLKIDGEVPENFNKITIEPDNDKIREYLKTNTCDWAHLEERGRHIEIK